MTEVCVDATGSAQQHGTLFGNQALPERYTNEVSYNKRSFELVLSVDKLDMEHGLACRRLRRCDV